MSYCRGGGGQPVCCCGGAGPDAVTSAVSAAAGAGSGHPQQVSRHSAADAALPRPADLRGPPDLLRVLPGVSRRAGRPDGLPERRALQHGPGRAARLCAVRGEPLPHLVPAGGVTVTPSRTRHGVTASRCHGVTASRFYDVTVCRTGPIPCSVFSGSLQRTKTPDWRSRSDD